MALQIAEGVGGVLCGNEVSADVKNLRQQSQNFWAAGSSQPELGRLERLDQLLSRGGLRGKGGGDLGGPDAVVDRAQFGRQTL